MERPLLIAALVVTTVFHLSHEAALDRLPEPDQSTLRELLRGQVLALVLFLLVIPVELARLRWAMTSAPLSAVPAALGLAAALVVWRLRRRAHRIYELAADDDNLEQVRRARELQRRTTIAGGSSVVSWVAVLVYKLT